MGTMIRDISEEVRTVIGGKSIGAIVPPLIFVAGNNFFGLFWGAAAAVGTAFLFGLARFLKGETVLYALGGWSAYWQRQALPIMPAMRPIIFSRGS